MTRRDTSRRGRWLLSRARDVSIRSGRPEDASALLELWQTSGTLPTVTDDQESIIRLLDNDKDALIVAESGGRIVASVIAAWDGWRGNLYRLAVAPDKRREGIARQLIGEAERRLLEKGAVRFSILVSNKGPAAKFWSSMGYSEDDRVSRFARTPHERDS
jgi:ribosomal protein S18 acetylase RimI-like enzyme